ncbi:MAG: glycosyltransferase family 92 protein [Selenomonadaceae bacterium]|nr:glycosyltransferase family 92 protein [Selenomonadaceae bacterium]
MVDKDLFLYDLAVVAILRDEGHYLKEWLDYHLVAGVDHFYLYDNGSTDNQAEVAKPYVESGLVDYIPFPGKVMQMVAYNDAVKRFKFHCRYMAFIDGDEFIYPRAIKADGERYSIVEVLDEVFSQFPNAAGLSINWNRYGSNEQEKADYSRGVLERFTRRAPRDWFCGKKGDFGNAHVKTIANPRRIKSTYAHIPTFYKDYCSVNALGKVAQYYFSTPPTSEKIVVNHYIYKSREEYLIKIERGSAANINREKKIELFDNEKNFHNKEFDDSILEYRDIRTKVYQPPEPRTDEDLIKALEKNCHPLFLTNTPPEFYERNMETFLTCRSLASYLQSKFPDNARIKFLEKASLHAILKALSREVSIADMNLLIKDLPNLLPLPYPVVNDLRKACMSTAIYKKFQDDTSRLLSKLMEDLHLQENTLENFYMLDYLRDFLRRI